MNDTSDAINREKRSKATNEFARLIRVCEKHLNRSTETEFVAALNEIRPALSIERFQLALKVFRENQRS